MEYLKLLEEQRLHYKEKSFLFSNDDIKYIASKDTLKGKFTGFLTRAYHQRDKVIKLGEIFYGYVFEEYNSNLNNDSAPLSFILFSPEQKIMENPEIYKKTVENLRDFLKNENLSKKEKQLKDLLNRPLASAPFEELPTSVTEGHLVYFIKMYRNRNFAYSFNLGLNLFIANLAVSKQILYLPERYMTETFKEAYDNHQLVF